MNRERQADEIGRDRRAARPGLDRRLLIGRLRLLDFYQQVIFYKRAFFNRASHKILLGLDRQPVAADHDELVGRFIFYAGFAALGPPAPRRHQLLPATTALGFALTTTIRMVHRVARHTARDAAMTAMPRAASLAQNHILMLRIANLANRRITLFMHLADFA